MISLSVPLLVLFSPQWYVLGFSPATAKKHLKEELEERYGKQGAQTAMLDRAQFPDNYYINRSVSALTLVCWWGWGIYVALMKFH